MANRGRHAKKIDTVHWTGVLASSSAISAGTLGATVVAAQHLPETLLRFRGEWMGSLIGALANGVGVHLHAGLIQVPEGTGTTVLWSPFIDADAPWIWWDVMTLVYNEFVTDVNWSSQVSDGRRVIDSKAMRKLRNTELQIVLENTTYTGKSAGDIDFAVAGRVLAGS